MAKITRKTAKLFATTGAGTDVEQFASFEVNGVPNYTTNPATIMALPAWRLGWSATQLDGIFAPYFQDRNGVDLVAFYQIAYLLQQGIAEWDSATPYFTDSVVQNGGGVYQSLQDNNTGNAPPAGASNAFWQICAFPSTNTAKSPTRTVYTAESGKYTPPAGCVRLLVRMVGGGGGGGAPGGSETEGFGGSDYSTFITLGLGIGLGFVAGGGGGGGGNNGTLGSPQFPAGYAGTFVTFPGSIPGAIVFSVNGSEGSEGYDSGYGPAGNGNGAGGTGKFGGAGPAVASGSNAGINASASSGGGGSGSSLLGVNQAIGGGGGGGAYAEILIYAALTENFEDGFDYQVGGGGTGGSVAGVPSGGNGAAGIIIIDEFYY